MQKKLEEDEFNELLVFNDEATFHTNAKVNRHNVRIWGEENPHATIEHERDSPKVFEMAQMCVVPSRKTMFMAHFSLREM